jgi:hypothetical protein
MNSSPGPYPVVKYRCFSITYNGKSRDRESLPRPPPSPLSQDESLFQHATERNASQKMTDSNKVLVVDNGTGVSICLICQRLGCMIFILPRSLFLIEVPPLYVYGM